MNKKELTARIREELYTIIELGCGSNKRTEGIGIDALDLAGVDYVADLEKGLPFLEDKSVDEIHSYHFLEHIENFELLVQEMHRVLKPRGRIKVVVPHFSNPYYYSDYTHRRFFGLYSFDYFGAQETMLKRKVPSFYGEVKFLVHKRRLNFRAPYFILSNFIGKKIIQPLVNLSDWSKEFYERRFCYLYPCYELEFELEPVNENKKYDES